MCIVSEKIKFCTCATGEVEKLKHYWALYRFNKKKDLVCMGEPMIPSSWTDKNFELNESKLLARINDSDAFDCHLQLKPKDVLEIVINNNMPNHDALIFVFEFKNGKWQTTEFDPFCLMNHYDEEKYGKIKNALKFDPLK